MSAEGDDTKALRAEVRKLEQRLAQVWELYQNSRELCRRYEAELREQVEKTNRLEQRLAAIRQAAGFEQEEPESVFGSEDERQRRQSKQQSPADPRHPDRDDEVTINPAKRLNSENLVRDALKSPAEVTTGIKSREEDEGAESQRSFSSLMADSKARLLSVDGHALRVGDDEDHVERKVDVSSSAHQGIYIVAQKGSECRPQTTGRLYQKQPPFIVESTVPEAQIESFLLPTSKDVPAEDECIPQRVRGKDLRVRFEEGSPSVLANDEPPGQSFAAAPLLPEVIESSLAPEDNVIVEPTQFPLTDADDTEMPTLARSPLPNRKPLDDLEQSNVPSPDLLFTKMTPPPQPKRLELADDELAQSANRSAPVVVDTPGTTQKDEPITRVSEGLASPDLLVPDETFSKRASPVAMRTLEERPAPHLKDGAKPKEGREPARLRLEDIKCCDDCRNYYRQTIATLRSGDDILPIMSRYSQHRHRKAETATPDGYWDIWSLPEESAPPSPRVRPAPPGLFRPKKLL